MEHTGKIVQVSGPVVDVEFEDGNLPSVKEALYVINNQKKCVIAPKRWQNGTDVRDIIPDSWIRL